MSLASCLLAIIEDEAPGDYHSLPPARKFDLFVRWVGHGEIKSEEEFAKHLDLVGWDKEEFLKVFKDLWRTKRINWPELELLDSQNYKTIPIRWMSANIGDKEVCDRFPPKRWDRNSYCQKCWDVTGR